MISAGGKTASEISEMLLELTGDALLSNDFDAFALCFHVPHVIETPDKKTVLKTRSALREVFDRVVADYAEKNVTSLVRYCEVAKFHGAFKIEAMHVTHMMSGNLRVKDPFPTYGILEFIENRWQATSSQYAVDSDTTVGKALANSIPDTDIQPRAKPSGATDKRKN